MEAASGMGDRGDHALLTLIKPLFWGRWRPSIVMSALTQQADIYRRLSQVRFGPEAEVMAHQRLAKGRHFGK